MITCNSIRLNSLNVTSEAVSDATTLVSSSKSGIDIVLSGLRGWDWEQEYFFYDRQINDRSVIYIREDTLIGFEHNSRNVSYTGSGEYAAVTGGNDGAIMFKIDRDMQFGRMWGDATADQTFYEFGGGIQTISETNNETYTEPFALADKTYDGSTPVVGTTGASGTVTDWEGYHWRGIEDSVGDEWHVVTVADYDGFVSDSEGKASDGKVFLFVVNPKTPILKVSATGDAQYYTTPAKVYFVPKINDQTTYFDAGSGSVTFTLKDINGNNIFYRINGGGWVNAGASSVELDQDDFSDGSNTLEYYYAGNAAYTKTRTIVKNPDFPSSGETHGMLLFGNEDRFDLADGRKNRAPYQVEYERTWNNDLLNPLTAWDSAYRSGRRTVYGRHAIKSAIAAALRGWESVPTGKSITSAAYAKQMLMDSERNIDPVGFEINHSGRAIPTRELFIRGYYDMDCTFSLAFTYDLLIANFKSTDYDGGITPVEDYFIRDMLAGCVMDAMMQEGNWTSQQYQNTGMWGTSRNVGGLICSLAIPHYSTEYYGTAGYDGNTTVYPYTPFPDTPLTWKKVFFDNDATLVGYPNLNYRLGIEEVEWPSSSVGDFENRVDYLGTHLMGHIFYILSSMNKAGGLGLEFPNMEAGFQKIADGTVVGLQIPSEVYSALPFGALLICNQLHPDTHADLITQGQSHTNGDPEEENYEMYRLNPYSLVYYDDEVS